MYSQGILPRQDVQQRQRQQHSIRRNLNSSYSGFRSTFSTRHHPGTVATTVAEDRNQLLLEAELRLAQRDKRWFQSALAEANHKLEESQRDIQRLLVCESQLQDMETKFKSAEAEKTKILDMVRKGVTEAEKAIEDERSRFHERTKEYESKLNEALELGAEAKAEAKDLEEQLCAAREEIRSAEKRVDSEADEKIQILEISVGRLEEQLRVANDRIKFMMKENEGKEKRIGELQSEQDDLKRQLKEERESFQIKLQNTLKDQREKHDKIVNMLRRDIEAASLRKHDKIKEEVKKLPLLTDVLESSTNKNPVVLEKKKVSSASVIVLDELNKKLSFLKDRNLSSQYHRRISSSSSSSEMFRHEKKNNSNNTKQVVSEATREIPRYMKPKRVEKQQSPPLDVVVKKENWQSNLRDRNGDAIVIAKKKSNLRKPRKMSNVLSAQRQNRIRSSRQKETQKEFVDPQKKALVRNNVDIYISLHLIDSLYKHTPKQKKNRFVFVSVEYEIDRNMYLPNFRNKK